MGMRECFATALRESELEEVGGARWCASEGESKLCVSLFIGSLKERGPSN